MKVNISSYIVSKGKQFKILLLVTFFCGFIVDAFFVIPENTYTDWGADVRLFSLLALWLFIVKISHFKSIATFKLVLIFFITFSLFFVFFPTYFSVERLASWIYVFLALGVIQQLFEARKNVVN